MACEQTLAESDYFAGPAFTAADVMMVFPFTTLLEFLPGTVDLAPWRCLGPIPMRWPAR